MNTRSSTVQTTLLQLYIVLLSGTCYKSRYKYTKARRRPILVKMSRSCEVSSILANRRKLAESPGVSIKPEMTREERSIESTLLRKRWELLNTGVHRGNIKIRGKSLFVNNHIHGSVINSAYITHDSTTNHDNDSEHSSETGTNSDHRNSVD